MNQPSRAPRSGIPWWVFGLIGCVVAAPFLIALIGIVAAIAIPNFIMFQCKSKQQEAKIRLQEIHAAQQSFHAEHGFYTTDLVALGFTVGHANPAYLYGFAEPGPDRLPPGAIAPADLDPTRKDTADPALLDETYSTERMRTLDGTPLSPDDLPADAIVTDRGFVAAAVADIDVDSFTRLDVWTIDETGRLTVLDNDCRN